MEQEKKKKSQCLKITTKCLMLIILVPKFKYFHFKDCLDSFVWKWDILGDFSNTVEEVMDIFDN